MRARALQAKQSLEQCEFCELRCGVNRLLGEKAPCGLGEETWIFKNHISFAEEIELLPSYMVYLSGCNFRCRFCVQAPSCFSPKGESLLIPTHYHTHLTSVLAKGAKTINFLGGEPSLHIHTLLELVAEMQTHLPFVFNSNMYMTPQVLEWLAGTVSLYLADFKFGNDECALRDAKIPHYLATVTRNLLIAEKQSKMFVRHLLMPNHLECCFYPVADWIAQHMPHIPFHLMLSYVPAWKAQKDIKLGRTLSKQESQNALDYARKLSLNLISNEASLL